MYFYYIGTSDRLFELGCVCRGSYSPEAPSTPNVRFLASKIQKIRIGTRVRFSTSIRGSKYPLFMVSGPKTHEGYGFWNQKPQTLAACTLWVI